MGSSKKADIGLVPSPKVLALYRAIDPSFPSLVIEAADKQREREFRYARGGQFIAGLSLSLFGGGYVYLVMQGHPKMAGILLGAGILNAIGSFLRARLSFHEGNQESAHETLQEDFAFPADE